MEPEKDLKIYRYCEPQDDMHIPPMGLSYKTGLSIRLQSDVKMRRGEVYQVRKCVSATETPLGYVFSDPIVVEDITYERDAVGNAKKQTKVISWIQEDGNPSPITKTLEKFYSVSESINEGQRRRKNIVDYLKGATIHLLMQTELPKGKTAEEVMGMGREFVAKHEADINTFIDTSVPALFMNVQADTTTWLDNLVPNGDGATIRLFFLSELNIWGL